MAGQEQIERSLDLERDLATQAAPPKCCHPHLLPCCVPCTNFSLLPAYRGLQAASLSAWRHQFQGRSPARPYDRGDDPLSLPGASKYGSARNRATGPGETGRRRQSRRFRQREARE
jgi:hypothetical protein